VAAEIEAAPHTIAFEEEAKEIYGDLAAPEIGNRPSSSFLILAQICRT
jgi:hypothetical protein